MLEYLYRTTLGEIWNNLEGLEQEMTELPTGRIEVWPEQLDSRLKLVFITLLRVRKDECCSKYLQGLYTFINTKVVMQLYYSYTVMDIPIMTIPAS